MRITSRPVARVVGVLAIIGLIIAFSSASAAPPPEPQHPRVAADTAPCGGVIPGQILVQREPGVSLASLDLDVIERLASLDVAVCRVPEGQERAQADRLRQLPGVAFAQPNYVYGAHVVPNDEFYAGYQHNLPQIGMPAAWDISTGSASVVVAVLDSGTDLGHPELSSQVVAGYDTINHDSDPSDDNGHGTHVSGIVAAASNNSLGVASVAWHTRIMPVKVLGSDGRGSTVAIAEGIRWAVDHGADIINMSLGGTGDAGGDLVQKAAVDYAYAHGALLIASMGNHYEEGNPVEYPAAHEHVLAVGSVNNLDQHASYSCTGQHNDVVAPGGDATGNDDNNPDHWIMSTGWRGKGSNWAWYTGTSQAAPHVAGLAALMLAVNPSLSPDQLEQILKNTAVDLGTAGFDNTYGYGRINALAALQAAAASGATATPTITRQVSATPTVTPRSATPTATRRFTPGVQTRRGYLPAIMRNVSGPVAATPTPTRTTAPITPTPTTGPVGVLPTAGWWSSDWLIFVVAPDQRHITSLWYIGYCAELEIDETVLNIALDGTWSVQVEDGPLGVSLVGQFTSASSCAGTAENWDDSDTWNPCNASESWVATPD